MPLVALRIVLAPGMSISEGLAQRVADKLGSVLGCAQGHLWVRVTTLSSQSYAENMVSLNQSDLPVFVTLLHADLPTVHERSVEVLRVSQAVAQCVGRPVEQVHVEYAAPGRGRLAFGGNLLV